ncbi:MAG: polysaccharide biosynthesis protein [Bacteroidaceae bacterium]|nr:polysaccharide biosynthesis protein [Bacteroidaceae bacterium]
MGIFQRVTTWYFSKKALPYWCVLMLDCAIIVIAGMIGTYIVQGGGPLQSNGFWQHLLAIICSLPFFILGMRIFRTYSGVLRYSSFVDLTRVAGAVIVGLICTLIAERLLPEGIFPDLRIKSMLISGAIALILMWAERIIVKSVFNLHKIENAPHIYIYGVREGGVGLAKSILNENQSQYKIKGFISGTNEMVGKYLLGIKVYPPTLDTIKQMEADSVRAVLISPLLSESFRERQDLVDAITDAGIRIMMMPTAQKWDGKTQLSYSQLQEVEIEDLLPRDEITVDMQAIGELLANRVILITGAAGSIGSEMVRQIAQFKPQHLVLIDSAETPMHDIRLYMKNNYPDVQCDTIVSSITHKSHMDSIFAKNRPDYVFHAAAYKHVPMMEDNPSEAVFNNIFGTRVIADLAVKYGVKKFVMISTDKAVNPTNVMGCSKRICEIYCQALNKAIVEGQVKGVTQFVTTRFGNVLGSNGSVIPLFREQIKKGGPVTVTHPDIIRYFMLIPEACKLVLEAGTMGKGGEIFVFDMGKPVRIADLANRMIKLSGAKGVEVQFTGLRDGEKLYEEVLNDAETTKPTVHKKIMVASVREYKYEEALANEERLYETSRNYNDMETVRVMKEIVPEFKSRQSKYEAIDKENAAKNGETTESKE